MTDNTRQEAVEQAAKALRIPCGLIRAAGVPKTSHLYLGTHQDNMDDMVRRGRSTKRNG